MLQAIAPFMDTLSWEPYLGLLAIVPVVGALGIALDMYIEKRRSGR